MHAAAVCHTSLVAARRSLAICWSPLLAFLCNVFHVINGLLTYLLTYFTTVNVLDVLQTMCSSHDPAIVDHDATTAETIPPFDLGLPGPRSPLCYVAVNYVEANICDIGRSATACCNTNRCHYCKTVCVPKYNVIFIMFTVLLI